jgi:hypothetical protein
MSTHAQIAVDKLMGRLSHDQAEACRAVAELPQRLATNCAVCKEPECTERTATR